MIINSSRLGTFECETKYLWTYELNITSKRKAIPLMTGGAVHEGLHVWRLTGDVEKAKQAMEKMYREEAGNVVLGEQQEIIEKEIEMSRRMLHEYSIEYPTEAWEFTRPEQKFKVLLGDHCLKCGTEYPKHSEIKELLARSNKEVSVLKCRDLYTSNRVCDEPVHVLLGRVDAVVMWKGKMWNLESKTTKSAASNWIQSFSRDRQTGLYVYGMSKELGVKIAGTILDYLKKTKIPQFGRQLFMRANASINKAVSDCLTTVGYIEKLRKTGNYRQNTSECYRWKACPFIPLCEKFGDPKEIPLDEILPLGFERRKPDYGDPSFIEEKLS